QGRLYIGRAGRPPILRHEGTDYTLAVPRPGSAPTLANMNPPTPDLTETVQVAYTFVTSLGEESAPSPLAEIETDNVVTVRISAFDAPPGGRLINAIRIYRSQTDVSGVTALYFVAEAAADTNQYDPDVAETPLGDEITTLDFTDPPVGLTGLTAMPNGMVAAFKGRDIYFCEPYQPHAWPVKYSLSVDYDIVALSSFGTNLAILTTGEPYRAQGTHPDNMVMEKVEVNLPCVAAAGVVDFGYSAVYPSSDGLVEISGNGARVVSDALFTREQWQAMEPATIRACQFGRRYLFAFHGVLPGVYGAMPGTARKTCSIDMSGDMPSLRRYDFTPAALFFDVSEGNAYYAEDGHIQQFDDPAAVTRKTQRWRSRRYEMPQPTTFGALWVETAPGDTVTARVYANDALIATVTADGDIKRLPDGLAKAWEIEIEGTGMVTAITIAGTMDEIAAAGS
ncbi:UNVERIFIED_CONTAM: hypothetical protein BEN50_22400, partial [Euhalothece sp. KZN 001]